MLWHDVYEPQGAGVKLAGSFQDSVYNLQMDPDAERREDCKWIARRCVEPVWEVERSRGIPPGTIKANKESMGQQAAVDSTKISAALRRLRRNWLKPPLAKSPSAQPA